MSPSKLFRFRVLTKANPIEQHYFLELKEMQVIPILPILKTFLGVYQINLMPKAELITSC
jgi:hypothetical protein